MPGLIYLLAKFCPPKEGISDSLVLACSRIPSAEGRLIWHALCIYRVSPVARMRHRRDDDRITGKRRPWFVKFCLFCLLVRQARPNLFGPFAVSYSAQSLLLKIEFPLPADGILRTIIVSHGSLTKTQLRIKKPGHSARGHPPRLNFHPQSIRIAVKKYNNYNYSSGISPPATSTQSVTVPVNVIPALPNFKVYL